MIIIVLSKQNSFKQLINTIYYIYREEGNITNQQIKVKLNQKYEKIGVPTTKKKRKIPYLPLDCA